MCTICSANAVAAKPSVVVGINFRNGGVKMRGSGLPTNSLSSVVVGAMRYHAFECITNGSQYVAS
ncbi:MAG: hypothetical protein QOJ56_1483 [Mycobacterium sp.]|jgi:hypothetical protein|nr:hypothetical protein [Mycobacterium sp.]